MQIKILDDKGQELKQKEKRVEADYGQTIPEGIILLEQMGSLFNFTHAEVESYKTELNTLIEFAKTQTDNHSINELKWVLTDLGVRLGSPPLGEKRIKQLVRYAHLFLETKANKEELDKMVKEI